MNLSIIGTRGIPATYSGFETSVEETATRFARNNIKTTVYCRKNHYSQIHSKFRGVNLIHLPSIKTKHFDTISHTLLSVIHCLYNKCDTVHLYGLGNAVFLPILKLSGINTISIVDGADWQRKKWGFFAKNYLKFCRNLTVGCSGFYVVDNENLVYQYKKKYKVAPIYIPYGANNNLKFDKTILEKYNLLEKEYVIFVGRFVKEKGIEFLIKNFISLKADIKLVIVGGNDIDKDYDRRIKSMGNKYVLFTSFLYGKEYESLLKYSLFYISCSYLEGTSPSLLGAMAINGFALVSDLKENQEVLKGSCRTFKVGDSMDFRNKLQSSLNDNSIEKERLTTFEIVNNYYNWDKITDKYCKLMEILKKRNKT